jgi:hypothetical protein
LPCRRQGLLRSARTDESILQRTKKNPGPSLFVWLIPKVDSIAVLAGQHVALLLSFAKDGAVHRSAE